MIDMKLLEPITMENIHELNPGEWIWDNKTVFKREHVRSLGGDVISEALGFRQIDILDLDLFPKWGNKPFMLTDGSSRSTWERFESDRYFRFKR